MERFSRVELPAQSRAGVFESQKKGVSQLFYKSPLNLSIMADGRYGRRRRQRGTDNLDEWRTLSWQGNIGEMFAVILNLLALYTVRAIIFAPPLKC